MSAYSALILGDGPRAYWRLGEAAYPIADSSGNGASFTSGNAGGTLVLAQPSLLAGDPADKAMGFPTGWLSRGTIGSVLDVKDVFTIEAWIKLNSLSNGQQTIYCLWTSGHNLRINSANKLDLLAANTQDICQSSVALTDLNVHHVVATKNGATVKLYIDGVDVTGSITNYTFSAAPSWQGLGVSFVAGGEYANMSMDEVAFYPVALSQAQVLAHFNTGRALPVTTITPTGIPSAQSFGTTKAGLPPQTVQVPGVLPSGYGLSITGQVITGDGHLVGGGLIGNNFGTPTVKNLTGPQLNPVEGVPSAQAFGTLAFKLGTPSVAVGGVPSAQSFGALKLAFGIPLAGVPSAQRFGAVTIHAGPVFIPVLGVPSAQAFGIHVFVYRVYIRPSPPTQIILTPVVPEESPWILVPSPAASLVLTPNKEE